MAMSDYRPLFENTMHQVGTSIKPDNDFRAKQAVLCLWHVIELYNANKGQAVEEPSLLLEKIADKAISVKLESTTRTAILGTYHFIERSNYRLGWKRIAKLTDKAILNNLPEASREGLSFMKMSASRFWLLDDLEYRTVLNTLSDKYRQAFKKEYFA